MKMLSGHFICGVNYFVISTTLKNYNFESTTLFDYLNTLKNNHESNMK